MVTMLGCGASPERLMPSELLNRVTEGHSCGGSSYVAIDEERTVRVEAWWYGSTGIDGLAPDQVEVQLVPPDALDPRAEEPGAIFRIYQGSCLWLDQCSDVQLFDCAADIHQVWLARSGTLTLEHDGASAWGEVADAVLWDHTMVAYGDEPIEADPPLGPVVLDAELPVVPMFGPSGSGE
jgi:hypothetical protein